jgi:uncharacterized protein (DUF2141 family)
MNTLTEKAAIAWAKLPKLPFSLVVLMLSFGLAITMAFTSPKTTQSNTTSVGSMVFHLTGLTPNRGMARVLLYNKEDKFMTPKGFCALDSAKVSANGTATVTIHNLPFGKYGGSVYQDENQNRVIDRNMAGVPIEPYGFTNNVRAKWEIPSFESTTFHFKAHGTSQQVRLAYWSAH